MIFEDPTEKVIPETFEEAQRRYLLFYSAITGIMCMVLIMAGTMLDRFFYPEKVGHFLVLRFIATALVGVALALSGTEWGKKYIKVLVISWAAIPQIMIAYMIALTDGANSDYYVGLTYALTGIAVFFPIKVWEAVLFATSTIGLYLLACLSVDTTALASDALLGNLVFLSFFVVVMLTVAIYGNKWRRNTYELQRAIQQQRDQIQHQHDENQRSNDELLSTRMQLVHSEKMASIGTLAAGLIHELNNPINYTLMGLMFMKGELAKGRTQEVGDALSDALEGVKRVQGIVKDLKTFAYQRGNEQDPRSGHFELASAVRVATRLTGHEAIGTSIAIEVPEGLFVKGDSAAISGVLINLISNAAHAIDQSTRGTEGRIVVKATIGTTPDSVMVSVFDNGCGIPPASLDKIFDPFFTTRQVGEGLGMGLSISYAIVQRHGSTLKVHSLQGEYTEFSFELEVDHEP